MAQRFTLQRVTTLVALCQVWSHVGAAQQRDTTTRPADSLKVYTLPPAIVSVTRGNPPINKIPQAVQLVEKAAISQARPTWGLDEALASVPGVYAANRYNFSLDQRISIRGFGARSQFAVRGVKVLVDGIPQTLPDGTGQLTNLELGEADRIEVLRGSSSALFGNATGGVISVWTDPAVPTAVRQDARVLFGTFDRDLQHNWSKWQSSTTFRVGASSGMVTVSRLDYTGERQHSSADFRNLNSRWHFPLATGWSLAASAAIGWDPRADNPGALTAAELARNRDSAAAINLTKVAGKDVTQGQAGVTVRRQFPGGGDASLSLFGLTRSLKNPQTFAYINLDRVDYGARLVVNRPVPFGALDHRLTAGIDFQRQRDNRLNVGNTAGQPDTVRQLDQLEHVTEVGPFIQSALQLTPQVAVTGGLRYDWVTFEAQDRINTPKHPDGSGRRLMSALSGSVGVAVTPTTALTLYGNVGTSFETPTTTELTNRPDSAGGFNPNLSPQTATNYELGARGVAAGRLGWAAELFDRAVSSGGPRRAHRLPSGRHGGARPGVLPERWSLAPPRRGARGHVRARARSRSPHRLDLLRLPLHELRGHCRHNDPRHPRVGRPIHPRHPAALAPLSLAGAPGVRPRGLGGARGGPLVGIHRRRHAQHDHRSLVDHQRSAGVGRGDRDCTAAAVCGLQQRLEPRVCGVGGHQRGAG